MHAACSDCTANVKPANSVFAVSAAFDGASNACPW